MPLCWVARRATPRSGWFSAYVGARSDVTVALGDLRHRFAQGGLLALGGPCSVHAAVAVALLDEPDHHGRVGAVQADPFRVPGLRSGGRCPLALDSRAVLGELDPEVPPLFGEG